VSPGEMITEVRVPALSPGGGAVVEISRRVSDFAIAGAAVSLWGDGAQPAAIALFGVGPIPVRAQAAEALLSDRYGAPSTEVGAAAMSEVSPSGDIHGSAEYRRSVAGVCVERALARARKGGS